MLLLDSQTAVWLLDDNPRLGVDTRRRIESATEVYVSAATIWELTIKSMLGKLTVPPELTDLLVDQGLSVLDVTGYHAEALSEFPELSRHDPFDRLITAQAYCERLRLLTADKILLGLGRDYIIDSTR
ncbi:type II toxin-antitoxin system VapC family toxin [Nocardia sp. CDC159]|uniref:Type II toxin-antitoxin system VapC family toxin n=1 Tax=Nocardia pulmonis TaxID=2951408 RepID=A0A9X2E7W2_9NOCA|nr:MULTISPECIES: type II toxin-antitoxin system VapC family toxin [Nocardia]MCM6775742.1 type II toxin-antitoxin system VapC family toxin [Nocardia pulmonis]MCM6788282.1 type II toxin-antitoxin system VapC family toxin [Nocardia sp. CDC159]